MPKINLLPKERAAASKKKRGLAYGIFFALAYLAVLALVFVSIKGRETAAEDDLATQLSANQRIQAEIDELAPYEELRSTYEGGVMRLQEALALDVAWGRLLSDFGRMISDKRVWLTSLDIQVVAVPDAVEGEEDPSAPMAPVFGAITMGGEGFEYADVAAWLVTLDSQDWEDVGAAWASTVNAGGGEVPTVTWSITSVLSERALTERAATLTPEVPE